MNENSNTAIGFQLNFNKWNIVYVAVVVSALLTIVNLVMYGVEKQGIINWLDATGRAGMITFTAAFIASPLHKLFSSSFSRWLLKNRRFIGIAFGFQHLVFHLPAVIWFLVIAKAPIDAIITGGIGFVFVIPMLITSFNAPAKWIGARNWKILHTTGMFYLMYVFIISFFPGISGNPSLNQDYLTNYALLELTLLIAVFLRIVVFIRKIIEFNRNKQTTV
jgi:DMSO/TMAO reductase YedYZ heme-binding membrane subunit